MVEGDDPTEIFGLGLCSLRVVELVGEAPRVHDTLRKDILAGPKHKAKAIDRSKHWIVLGCERMSGL